MINRIIEGTITLVIIYLVLANGKSFSSILQTGGAVYANSVGVLQGRK